jgi:hypothetical protein
MRGSIVGVLVGAIALMAAAISVPVSAQAPSKVTSTSVPAPAKPFTMPKTPWGDPDISGTWSSDDLRGVPVQRPDEFAGRAELSDEEFAKRVAANDEARTRELNRVGAFRNDVGTRTFRQTSLVVEPSDGKLPLTPEAQREVNRRQVQRSNPPATWTDRSLYDRCITRGIFGSVLPVIYGNGNFIFQAPGYVSITYEMVHDTRIIPLDGRPHIGSGIKQYLGDARGHFEGDTLVVETTNFLGNTTGVGGNGGGAPTSDVLRVVERFTRVAQDVLNYEVSIDDPKTFTKPVKLLLPLTTQPGYQVLPYECHEGNLALHNILSAARAEEKAIEEALKKGLPRPKPSVWLGGIAPGAPDQ